MVIVASLTKSVAALLNPLRHYNLRSATCSISTCLSHLAGSGIMNKSNIKPAHLIATEHLERVAIKDINGTHSYRDVLHKAVKLSLLIRKSIGLNRNQERIGFICPNDITYVVTQWACWAAGHIGNMRKYCVFLPSVFFSCSCSYLIPHFQIVGM